MDQENQLLSACKTVSFMEEKRTIRLQLLRLLVPTLPPTTKLPFNSNSTIKLLETLPFLTSLSMPNATRTLSQMLELPRMLLD